jgi:hypothetical protein
MDLDLDKSTKELMLMAFSNNLPADAMEQIAEQVAEGIADLAGESFAPFEAVAEDPVATPAPLVDLAEESFEVWILEFGTIEQNWDSGKDLLLLAKATGRWHHQIRFNGVGHAFARSSLQKDNDEPLLIKELIVSPLARKIDEAIHWIDSNVQENYLTHMLSVPAYQLIAFWLIDEANQTSQVFTISSPNLGEGLATNQLIKSDVFLSELVKRKPFSGIIS